MDTNSCNLCQDGSAVSTPDKVIDLLLLEQTCADLADQALNSPSYDCAYYHLIGNHCGCTNTLPSDLCMICQDGSMVSDPNKLVLEDPRGSCGKMEEDAPLAGLRGDDCELYHYYGTLCGCKANTPPSDGCSLCSDGSSPAFPDKITSQDPTTEYDCAQEVTLAKFLIKSDTSDCRADQSVVGEFCGCPANPQKSCSICEPGKSLISNEAPAYVLEYTTASGDVGSFDVATDTCVNSAFVANSFDLNATQCSNLAMQIGGACCAEPSGAMQHNPLVFVVALALLMFI